MFGPSRNRPIKLDDPRPVDRVLDDRTGDAGRDGYTRVSQADRMTGQRSTVGGRPVRPSLRPYYED